MSKAGNSLWNIQVSKAAAERGGSERVSGSGEELDLEAGRQTGCSECVWQVFPPKPLHKAATVFSAMHRSDRLKG